MSGFKFHEKTLRRCHVLLALFLLVGSTFTGCRDSRDDSLFPYGWEKVGERFDSVTLVLERRFLKYRDFDSARQDIELLRELADEDRGDTRQIKQARYLYWKARYERAKGSSKMQFDRMLDSTSAMIDSARYPYDARRIRWTKDAYNGAPVSATKEWYNQITDDIAFYESVGDYMIAGDLYLQLASTLSEVGCDPDEALRMVDTADSLFAIAGMNRNIVNNELNRATILSRTDPAKAAVILRGMLNDTIVRSQPDMMYKIYHNLYSYVQDTAALRKGYGYLTASKADSCMKCYYLCLLADVALIKGDTATAGAYADSVLSSLDCLDSNDALKEVAYISLANILTMREEFQAADYLMMTAHNLRKARENSTARNYIIKTELNKYIAEAKLAAIKASYRRTIGLLCVIFVLVLGGGVMAWLAYRKIQRQNLINMSDKLEAERSQRKVLAMTLVLEEKDNMMTSLEGTLDELASEGEIPTGAAQRMKNSIKIHSGSQDESEGFIETFTKIHPQFSTHLKGDFPSLTETELKLASMITIGLENKHIARILAIRPESVKQARWRLRSKLGLDTAESLSDFLARYK